MEEAQQIRELGLPIGALQSEIRDFPRMETRRRPVASPERPAAVHRQNRPGHERQARAHREHGACDLLRRGEPAQRRAAGLLVSPALVQPAHELSVDKTRRDRNHANVGRKRTRERLCQIVDRGLRGAIDDVAPLSP